MTGPEAVPRRRRRQTVGKGPVLGSAIIHTIVILLAWWTTATPNEVPDFITFEIELISPSAAELGESTTPLPEELVIETPFDAVPEPPEEPPPTVAPPDTPIPTATQPPAPPAPKEGALVTAQQNAQLYNGNVSLRAPGKPIVGDNTSQFGMNYTKATNIGLDLVSTMVADRQGLTEAQAAREHVRAVLAELQTITGDTYQGIFPEFYKIEGGRFFAEVQNGRIRYSSIDSAWLTVAIDLIRTRYRDDSEIVQLAAETSWAAGLKAACAAAACSES